MRLSSADDAAADRPGPMRILAERQPAKAWPPAVVMLPLVIALGALLTTAGCMTRPSTTPAQPPVASTITDDIATYLDTMDALSTGDTDHQIDVFDEVERTYLAAPTTASTLRYAAALITVGHPGAAPQRGRELLADLISRPGTLTPNERKLGSILLAQADALVALETENRRLVATVDEQAQAQLSSARRTLALAGENERLREALEQAQQQLNAITDIERSIIERDSSPGTVSPPRESPAPETQGPPPGR